MGALLAVPAFASSVSDFFDYIKIKKIKNHLKKYKLLRYVILKNSKRRIKEDKERGKEEISNYRNFRFRPAKFLSINRTFSKIYNCEFLVSIFIYS